MAYVVCEPCINCKYTNCVDVCPVDCFREGVNFLVIDPDRCIDCGACEPECPSEAIYEQDEVPKKWEHYIELNQRYAELWPMIDETKEPLEGADDWKDREDKEGHLSPDPFED